MVVRTGADQIRLVVRPVVSEWLDGVSFRVSRAVVSQIGRLDHIGSGLPQKSRQMDEINAVLAVIILRQADNPARAVAYRPLDAPLPLQWS